MVVTITMSSTQQPIKIQDVPIVTPPLKAKKGKKKAKKIPVQPLEDIPCRGCASVMVDPLDYGYGFCSRSCAYGDQQDYY